MGLSGGVREGMFLGVNGKHFSDRKVKSNSKFRIQRYPKLKGSRIQASVQPGEQEVTLKERWN